MVSSLWPLEDSLRARFSRLFYQNLESNPDVAEALSMTKRAMLAGNTGDDRAAWAAFQLYVH